MGTSIAAANSALQRARSTLRLRYSSGPPPELPIPDEAQRRLLDRYVQTWEAADIEGFVGLLAADAVWSMPPWRQWYAGRTAVGGFVSWAFRRGAGHARLFPTWANGQPAFGYYLLSDDHIWQAIAIQVIDLRRAEVASITNFVNGDLFADFGLPRILGSQAPDR